MANDWNNQAEFIATVVDARGQDLWLVELGAGKQVVASISRAKWGMLDLVPGDVVRIKFRIGNKTPRIVGYSEVDRSGQPTTHGG